MTYHVTGAAAVKAASILWLALVPCAAVANDATQLANQINAYRAAPGTCEGRTAAPVAPLSPHAALTGFRIGTGTFLELALERRGYDAERADAIVVQGAADLADAMDTIRSQYCKVLLSTQFSDIGVVKRADEWQIVLAQPVAPLVLPAWQEAGKEILAGVNRARATGRLCGEKYYPAVGQLAWNDQLGDAALAHSEDMARQKYFAHKGKDGATAGERATRAKYRWRSIGENIAAGQTAAEQAVAGWLTSPGHCANIMHANFTEMGGAYAIRTDRRPSRVYWTQVFGTPR